MYNVCVTRSCNSSEMYTYSQLSHEYSDILMSHLSHEYSDILMSHLSHEYSNIVMCQALISVKYLILDDIKNKNCSEKNNKNITYT